MLSFKAYFLEAMNHPKCGECIKGSCEGCPIFEDEDLEIYSGDLTYEKLNQALKSGNGKFKIGTFPIRETHHIFIWTGKGNYQDKIEDWLKKETSMRVALSGIFSFDSQTNTISSESKDNSPLTRGLLQAVRNKISKTLNIQVK